MKNLIVLISLTVLFTGCSDFLEEDNRSNVTDAEFYTTEEGFQVLINSNYSQLREIYGQEPWLFVAGTDLYAEGRDQEPPGLSQYTQLNPSSEGVGYLYEQCFKAIQLANTGLFYADQVAATDQQLGELRFLRAHAYFLLVQQYGGVTIIDEAIQEAVTSFERNSAEDVYRLIIDDFELALDLVEDGSYNGRITRKAVNHFLAKVYLTRAYEDFGESSDFRTAATYAGAAIDGQSLSLSFDEIWAPGNELNDETIFSVQYDAISAAADPQNFGSTQQNFFGSYLGGSEVAEIAPYKSYTLIATNYALSLFEEGDERWEGTFMTEIAEEASGGYWAFYQNEDFQSLPLEVFYEPSWFDDADSAAYVNSRQVQRYRSFGSHDSNSGDFSLDKNLIICKKFDDPSAPFAGGELSGVSRRDFIVARLAETYLIAAEANLGAGDAGPALDFINQLKVLRGASPVATVDIDEILDERARELFGEYHRWGDLKRTGKLVERASAHHPLISEGNFNGVAALKILRPIPQEALDLNRNDGFQQNPAYN